MRLVIETLIPNAYSRGEPITHQLVFPMLELPEEIVGEVIHYLDRFAEFKSGTEIKLTIKEH